MQNASALQAQQPSAPRKKNIYISQQAQRKKMAQIRAAQKNYWDQNMKALVDRYNAGEELEALCKIYKTTVETIRYQLHRARMAGWIMRPVYKRKPARKPGLKDYLSAEGSEKLAEHMDKFWRAQGSETHKFWLEQQGDAFIIKSNLVNGWPPNFRPTKDAIVLRRGRA